MRLSSNVAKQELVSETLTGKTKSSPAPVYQNVERIRQKVQRRAERIWHLRRQMSADEWEAFMMSHPDAAGWSDWLPDNTC
jgi:hypothetical protein